MLLLSPRHLLNPVPMLIGTLVLGARTIQKLVLKSDNVIETGVALSYIHCV